MTDEAVDELRLRLAGLGWDSDLVRNYLTAAIHSSRWSFEGVDEMEVPAAPNSASPPSELQKAVAELLAPKTVRPGLRGGTNK
jgi:hypothetical protein